MNRSGARERARSRAERVRSHIVAALHSGRLKPGERVVSVRELAGRLALDPKTVHRAYARLAAEGLLETRRGSGTFAAEARGGNAGRPAASQLVVAVNRCRAEAASLGLSPSVFARFLDFHLSERLRGVPLAIAECNREQVGVFGLELAQTLGVEPRPALLEELRRNPRRVLGSARGIVSTDFHLTEVRALVEPLGIVVYRIALEPAVPRALVERAARGPIVMVVSDGSFASGFLRFLDELGVTAEVRSRFRIVEPPEAPAALRAARAGGTVYLSPLVERVMEGKVPPSFELLRVRHHLAVASLERLRARLALDVVLG